MKIKSLTIIDDEGKEVCLVEKDVHPYPSCVGCYFFKRKDMCKLFNCDKEPYRVWAEWTTWKTKVT